MIIHKLRKITIFRGLKIQENGLRSRDMSRLYTKRPACTVRTRFTSAGLNECYAAFFVIIYGVSVALILAFLEIIWRKW